VASAHCQGNGWGCGRTRALTTQEQLGRKRDAFHFRSSAGVLSSHYAVGVQWYLVLASGHLIIPVPDYKQIFQSTWQEHDCA